MMITINREFNGSLQGAAATIGKLSIDDTEYCDTLEPAPADGLYKGHIPAGDYKIILTFSPKFNRVMPLLCDVAGFSDIRIHPGNYPRDTEGCILVGMYAQGVMLINSDKSFNYLYELISQAYSEGEEIICKVADVPPPAIGG